MYHSIVGFFIHFQECLDMVWVPDGKFLANQRRLPWGRNPLRPNPHDSTYTVTIMTGLVLCTMVLNLFNNISDRAQLQQYEAKKCIVG